MKNKNIITTVLTFSLMVLGVSCSESFLEVDPPGAYSEPSLQNLEGVEGMLIATYSALDGSWFESWGNNHFNQNGGASNWIWGSMLSDVAYKGTEPSDGVDLNPLERFEALPNNPYLANKWNACYDGIGKANAVLKNLEVIRDEIAEATADRIEGEARFLRAHFHFEARKVFGNPAWVDETVTEYALVKNDQDIFPMIEADFQFAYDNLPGTQTASGRANKYAAGAYLAKVYVFQAKWSDAKPVLDDVINNGTTAAGSPYALMPHFYDNFVAAMEDGSTESIFAYEASFGDGSISNGNYENTLNQPHGSSALTGCCGFFQPSQNLVNSYKTDALGLPLPDTYNDTDIPDDEELNDPVNDPFTPYGGNLDPRLDWTVGRRDIPFLDWGINPGLGGGSWVRDADNGGPYNPMKTVPLASDFNNNLAGVIDWGFTSTAKNVNIIRFAEVLLLAAEVEAELGNLGPATTYVNMVRERAFDDPATDFVQNGGTDAANYVMDVYPTFGSQGEALEAIRFERKLELAMEGHRYFDLVRWHKATQAGSTALDFDMVDYMNNEYLAGEDDREHLDGAKFAAKYMYMPIPDQVIIQSTVGGERNIVQNDGFN